MPKRRRGHSRAVLAVRPIRQRNLFTIEPKQDISTGHFGEKWSKQSMIKVQNLAKVFGTKRAVDDVSFSVNRG